MNALNTVVANAMEKYKLGEAGFVKHDIFSFPALVEKVCSDDICNIPKFSKIKFSSCIHGILHFKIISKVWNLVLS
jgi:hypothetical protein